MSMRSFLFLYAMILTQESSASSVLPGFSVNSKAICRLQLSAQTPRHDSPFVTSFLARRSIAEAQQAGSAGYMNRDLMKIFDLESGTNAKSFVLENLWWGEGEALIKPYDKNYGKEGFALLPKDGAPVPRYTGEMLFAGDKAQARIIVTVTDATKAVAPSDLLKIPKLKPSAEVAVTINDSGKNMTEEIFRAWVQSLISESGMSQDFSNFDKLQISSKIKKDGSTDYTFSMPRRTLPYRELTWFVENVQKSLAADEYWQTRREFEGRIGIQSRTPESTSYPASPFSGTRVNLSIMSPMTWEEVERLTPSTTNNTSGKKKDGRPRANPYKRSKAKTGWDSEDRED